MACYCPKLFVPLAPMTLHKQSKWIVSYPADIVLAFCGDGLIDHFLTANAEENFFNFVQEFLKKQKQSVLRHFWGSQIWRKAAILTGPSERDCMASSHTFLFAVSFFISVFCSLVSLYSSTFTFLGVLAGEVLEDSVKEMEFSKSKRNKSGNPFGSMPQLVVDSLTNVFPCGTLA